jgi:type II secretory ATPase GspE/PulE/Tfp pilus assembly ATPase PilB-like protein
MITMREDGYLKALSGRTTVQEINRVASVDVN